VNRLRRSRYPVMMEPTVQRSPADLKVLDRPKRRRLRKT
jgi:hypothetical protein